MEVRFDEPVKVKISIGDFWIYAVCKQEGIHVQDGAGEWHGPLLSTQLNGEKLISALYDRLKLIAEVKEFAREIN